MGILLKALKAFEAGEERILVGHLELGVKSEQHVQRLCQRRVHCEFTHHELFCAYEYCEGTCVHARTHAKKTHAHTHYN